MHFVEHMAVQTETWRSHKMVMGTHQGRWSVKCWTLILVEIAIRASSLIETPREVGFSPDSGSEIFNRTSSAIEFVELTLESSILEELTIVVS